MLQLHVSVDIEASASQVRDILTDSASYSRWNPFIRALPGTARSGNRLRLTLQRHRQPEPSTTSTLTCLSEPDALRWRQARRVPFLFATEHRFRIESLPAGGVRLHRTAQLDGLFASLLGRNQQRAMEESFRLMNHALKARAERMGARADAAASATF